MRLPTMLTHSTVRIAGALLERIQVSIVTSTAKKGGAFPVASAESTLINCEHPHTAMLHESQHFGTLPQVARVGVLKNPGHTQLSKAPGDVHGCLGQSVAVLHLRFQAPCQVRVTPGIAQRAQRAVLSDRKGTAGGCEHGCYQRALLSVAQQPLPLRPA